MILLYDKDLTLLGPIETAVRVGYDLKLNEIGSATLVLAQGDPMAEKIVVPASYARLYDGARDLGFFRFSSVPKAETGPAGTITYALQSAECTLLDAMLDDWHEVGGTGLNTRFVIEYILARQAEGLWTLGRCDFEDYYQYNFEDVTVLEALMSLGEVLTDDYRFCFDSTGDRWTLNLVRLGEEAAHALVYGRGTEHTSRSIDGRVVTRLYGRGYGEGDNQLTISPVNGGKSYLDADEATMKKWGIRVGVHVDRRQTDPATLKAHMEQILALGKDPTYSYEVYATDIWRQTGESWDDAEIGDKVIMLDEVEGKPVIVRVTGIRKDDMEGDPGGVVFTLCSSRPDTAEALNEIRDKIGVQELYSQGATNMYSMQISDNADEAHPLTMRFYVPGNVLRINSCLMKWQLERFRTYATLAKSGGGSVRTSQEGGGATVSIPQVTTSVGVTYSSQPMDTEGSFVSLSGGPKDYLGAVKARTGEAGAHSHNMTHAHAIPTHSHKGVAHTHSMTHAHAVPSHDHSFEGEKKTYSIAHNHSLAGSGAQATGAIYSGNKSIQVTPEGTVESSGTQWTTSPYDSVGGSVKAVTGEASAGTEGSGTLWTTAPYDAVEGNGIASTGENGAHTHENDHVHDMPHVHNIAHQHVIPSMSFELTPHRHSINLPDHTHELEYGVYEGTRAETIGIRVDGEDVPADAYGESLEFDVAKYMRKDSTGKVTRASWHEVEFIPDGLTRITANLFFQVFIQSRGAGDY